MRSLLPCAGTRSRDPDLGVGECSTNFSNTALHAVALSRSTITGTKRLKQSCVCV